MMTVNIEPRILDRFKRLELLGRMGHAYLFVGPKEVGKTQTALGVAKLVNCESSSTKPCESCVSCLKITSGNHPDVMIIKPQPDSIKIDQIRFLLSRLQLKAFEARVKVFIICEVDTMTIEAANSLLKTLEEPASNTLLILTTTHEQGNLDTIRSRCHVIKFFPASKESIERTLECSSSEAQFLSVYTDGCLGQANQLLENDFIIRKNQILDGFLKTPAGDSKKAMEKEDAREALQVLLSFLRDATLLKTGVPADELMFSDRLTDVRRVADRSFEELSAIYGQVVRTRELLDENLNTKMAFNILKERIWGN